MDPSTSTLPIIRAASAVLKTKFHHGAGPESMDQLGRLQLRGFLVDKYFRMLSKKLHHDVRGPFSWQFAREPAPEARARARAGWWLARAVAAAPLSTGSAPTEASPIMTGSSVCAGGRARRRFGGFAPGAGCWFARSRGTHEEGLPAPMSSLLTAHARNFLWPRARPHSSH